MYVVGGGKPEATTINNMELSSFLSVLSLTMLTDRQQIFVWVHSVVMP